MTNPTHIAHNLLLRSHSPEAASAIFAEKVSHKPLHLRPTSPDLTSQAARAQRRLQRLRKKEKSLRRQKPRPLSAREKRISGIYDIPKDAQRYEIYVPLHGMWQGYMREVLGMMVGKAAYITAQSAGSKLASADYHGAELLVVRSRCTSLVGLTGIVVRDTKFTFQIITKRNELKSEFLGFQVNETLKLLVLIRTLVIPKRHTIFQFEIPQHTGVERAEPPSIESDQKEKPNLPPIVFELHGSQFENRATDRATKKFKQKNPINL